MAVALASTRAAALRNRCSIVRRAGKCFPAIASRKIADSVQRAESQHRLAGTLFLFEIIAHVSKDEILMPGEFIGPGTVGNGCRLELGWYLEHGDAIEREKISIS